MKLFLTALVAFSALTASAAQTYCGWISNPTPGNTWLQDANGMLTISIQGGTQPAGVDLQAPAPGETIQYNGEYGDSCGCIKADVRNDNGDLTVTRILSSKAKPLSACLSDSAIRSEYKPITIIHSMGKAYTECVDQQNEMQIRFKGRSACVNQNNEYYYLAE